VVGGFVVTDRMLEMFKVKPSERAAAASSGQTSGQSPKGESASGDATS
jgi:NAD/NADP transhydrogenase alpha subunit